MAIEGPLRELGIHDVFQLIDLSRKSGTLRVTSDLRDDEGLVAFEGGRVVHATLRSKPITTPPLPSAGSRVSVAVSRKERERQLRAQVEAVVFELMSWTEGFLSFEDKPLGPDSEPAPVSLATASLLMEGARRIDEWSRIAQVVPNAAAVPALAPIEPDRDGPMLDLLPNEWQVLSLIDGERDIRDIASALSRDEFEISKVAYGLATTGIVIVRASKAAAKAEASEAAARVAAAHLDAALTAVRAGDFATARASCEQVLRLAPGSAAASRANATIEALERLEQVLQGDGEVHVYA